MRTRTTVTSALAAVVLFGATAAFTSPGPDADVTDTSAVVEGQWHIQASGARIIGGYGHNFAYDGENVRPIDGSAEMRLDSEAGTGRLEIRLRTTEESGPIRFSQDRAFSGEIRIVQMLNTREMDAARIAEDILLHGDTGNEAPVMPAVYNYFATWGPSRIFVNGEEVIPMIGSHTMFSEQARNEAGRIVNDEGEVYSPMVQDKTGFTNPHETEFHYVAHTTEPDQNNFPPHTGWIHLHFNDVEVIQKPGDVEIPHVASSMD